VWAVGDVGLRNPGASVALEALSTMAAHRGGVRAAAAGFLRAGPGGLVLSRYRVMRRAAADGVLRAEPGGLTLSLYSALQKHATRGSG